MRRENYFETVNILNSEQDIDKRYSNFFQLIGRRTVIHKCVEPVALLVYFAAYFQ